MCMYDGSHKNNTSKYLKYRAIIKSLTISSVEEYIEYNNKEEKDINNNNISIFTFKKNMKRKKKNDLCIRCNSENKCSIFFPCGHRCCCYKCAMYYFEIYKKVLSLKFDLMFLNLFHIIIINILFLY